MTPAPRPYREPVNLVLGTIALNILSLALPVMTLQVYDRVLPNPDSGTLPLLVAGVVAAIVLETCLRLARAWMLGWNGAVYEHDMTVKAMRHILSSDVSRSERTGAGEFLHRLSAIGRIKDFESGYVAVTITELAFIPVFLGVILYIAAPLAAVPLALLAVFAVFSAWQGKRLRAELEKRESVDDDRYDFLIECLKGIHTVKAFGIENLLVRRYETLQEKSGIASFRTAEASTAAFNAGTMLSHIMMAAVITAGAVFAVAGMVTTGALIATLQLSGRLMQPVQRALGLWARYQDIRISREKVDAIFDLPVYDTIPAATLPAPQGMVELKNVHFKDILRGVNLRINPFETIAIGGDAGTGKTVLMEIIAGLYPPDSGTVEIDGVDIRHYRPEELVRHVGYLAAEGIIFRGSIRDNITSFGNIREQAAQDIAHMLRVEHDVSRLPAGFDTPLQPGAADSVPPGLKQRIAMTRVLASRPKTILFDDADRALDREGYNLAFSLLGRLQRHASMILVSDDANITALAQRHYVLHDGLLLEKTWLPQRKPDTRKAAS